MSEEIVIRIAKPWSKLGWLGVFALGAASVVYASGPPVPSFMGSETLTAEKLNQLSRAVTDAQTRLDNLEATAATSPGTHMVVTEATIAGDPAGTSACVASTCNVLSHTAWLSGATRFGAGAYRLAIRPGTFSAAPTCLVVTNDVVGTTSAVVAPLPTTSSIDVLIFADGMAASTRDDVCSVICIGPK